MKRQRQIAFYGKGGIGKSTIVQNVAAALAADEKHVLLVGCDPKHDSARPFLGGTGPTTVVSLLKHGTSDPSLDQFLMRCHQRVDCVEVGGPEPGVGCAGRGILRTFELMADAKLLTSGRYDAVLYDVLGDVVCGGFAAPMRTGHAESVCVVLSGEFMALYAANNICRGIANYAARRPIRLAGLVLNRRNTANEDAVVAEFAARMGTRVLATVPRSDLISAAEAQRKAVVDLYPESEPAAACRDLAADLFSEASSGTVPTPLEDADLENLYFRLVSARI